MLDFVLVQVSENLLGKLGLALILILGLSLQDGLLAFFLGKVLLDCKVLDVYVQVNNHGL